MSIRKNFAFDHDREAQNNAPSSGDGADQPAANIPATGQPNSAYRAPAPSDRQDSSINYDADRAVNDQYHAARVGFGGSSASDLAPGVHNTGPGGVDQGLGGYGKAIG